MANETDNIKNKIILYRIGSTFYDTKEEADNAYATSVKVLAKMNLPITHKVVAMSVADVANYIMKEIDDSRIPNIDFH